jgi:hypothetical protein
MPLLNRKQILDYQDRKTEDVAVPEWEGSVRVRALSLLERNSYFQFVLKPVMTRDHKGRKVETLETDREKQIALGAKLVSMAVIDEDGRPVFSQEDVMLLAEKSAAPIDRIAEVVSRISGLAQNAVEEAEKNSDPVPGSDSAIN